MSAAKRKAAWCSNAQTAIKKTNIDNTMNAIEPSVYPSRRTHFQLCYYINSKQHKPLKALNPFVDGEKAGSLHGVNFQIYPSHHPRKTPKNKFSKPRPCCASISSGARHTTKQVGNLPDSEVFSRPGLKDVLIFEGIHGFGAGSAYPQGRQHNLFCVSIPSSTLWPRQSDGGFQFNKEPETMTTVNTPTTSKTDNTASSLDNTTRQQAAIENALSMALYFMRLPRTPSAIHAATAKTNRALTLLKTACTDSQTGGAA